MAKKSRALAQGVEVAQKASQEQKANVSNKLRQDIANLCASIGDRSFVIRQAEGEIVEFHAQIDTLRDQLRALEPASGPQATK